MTMLNTLLLDTDQWDLVLDAAGNIAMASPPYALAQDVASAVRTFLGEVWYDTTLGIPYQTEVLGKLPPAAMLTQLISTEALTVPGVVTAQCVITSFAAREVSGQIIFTDESGEETTIAF